MLLELVLVAAVLALAGLAVYQSNHRGPTASVGSTPAPVTTESLANSAAAIGTADAAGDAATSASADAMADELTASENDVSNLGGSSNDSF
jgi:hypothetical protein